MHVIDTTHIYIYIGMHTVLHTCTTTSLVRVVHHVCIECIRAILLLQVCQVRVPRLIMSVCIVTYCRRIARKIPNAFTHHYIHNCIIHDQNVELFDGPLPPAHRRGDH